MMNDYECELTYKNYVIKYSVADGNVSGVVYQLRTMFSADIADNRLTADEVIANVLDHLERPHH